MTREGMDLTRWMKMRNRWVSGWIGGCSGSWKKVNMNVCFIVSE